MPCHTKMKSIFLRALLWLYLLELGFMLVSSEPGYLDFDNLPDTNFSCAWRIVGGYYADVEAACQMFHVCTLGQNNETMDIRFLCLNGTVFDQSTRVCERIDEVDCEKSEQYYDNNRELYGNSAPLIIPGDAESGGPPSTTTTTSTTTTPRPKYYSSATPRQANTPHYYTTAKPKPGPTLQKLSLHHHQFSSDSPPDFRFNPKEINLKLNSDTSLDIKPVSYQQQRFNGDKNQHAIVTTHSYNKGDIKPKKTIDINYDFDYQEDKGYHPNYQSTGAGAEDEYEDDYKHQEERATIRIVSTPPSHQGYHFQRADRPPINPPLLYSSLSSPAPFKRHSDPKIKKSVSVSISDQNGKELVKLNNTPISAIFSDAYLDYTEEEVTLLPLFEDVPKVKPHRTKRSIDSELLKKQSFNMTDKEAADVLRFLLKWYTDYEKTTKKVTIPLSPETITEINKELSEKIFKTKVTTENPRNVTEVTEVLEARASRTAVEFEKYLEEDYQDYLNNFSNQTSKENLNTTSPEYDYYYYYDDEDDDNNTTNSSEHEMEDLSAMEQHQEKNLTNSNEILKKQQRQETEEGYGRQVSQENIQTNVNENDDSNAVEIPLYDYVDDNYEANTFNQGETKSEKIDVNEYVDDNYETSKNDVPAEMKMISENDMKKFTTTAVSTIETNIEVSTKGHFITIKENELFAKGSTKENNEVTTQSYKNQIAHAGNGKEEFYHFKESTELPIVTTSESILHRDPATIERTSLETVPKVTTPAIAITESTTDLSFMIKNIEQHTKSVATNIVMPSYNHPTPVIHTKIEEIPTEIPTTTGFETRNEGSIAEREKVFENISFTQKSLEATPSMRRQGRGRGRSRFTVATSENKSYEGTAAQGISYQSTRPSRGRNRNQSGIISSSTNFPTSNESEVISDNATTAVTKNITEYSITHLQETTTPILPITEDVTETEKIIMESHYKHGTSGGLSESEERISTMTTPKSSVTDGDIVSSRNSTEDHFLMKISATPDIENVPVKEDISETTVSLMPIEYLSNDSSSNEHVPSTEYILINDHNTSTHDQLISGEEYLSNTEQPTITGNIGNVPGNMSNSTESNNIILAPSTETIPQLELNKLSTVELGDLSDISDEGEDNSREEKISHSSTTEKWSRVSSRSRGRNRFNSSATSSISTKDKLALTTIEENSKTPELIDESLHTEEILENSEVHDIPTYGRSTVTSNLEGRNESVESVSIPSTTEINRVASKEISSFPIATVVISTTKESGNKKQEVDESAGLIPKEPLKDIEIQNISIADGLLPEDEDLTYNKEFSHINSTMAEKTENNEGTFNTRSSNNFDTAASSSSAPSEMPLTTQETLSTIMTQKINEDKSGTRSELNNLLKEHTSTFIPPEVERSKQQITRSQTSRGRGRNNFVTSTSTSTVAISGSISGLPLTTEEILTTITTPKEEEIPSTAIIQESEPQKSLMDVLGYSVFNKFSENEDVSLRELGYFSIPKTPAATYTVRPHHVRPRGKHRFSVLSSSVSPTNVEIATTENILSTISQYTEIPTTNALEVNDDLSATLRSSSNILSTLPYNDDTATTEEVLTTFKVPETTATSFSYKRKEGHRFNFVPTRHTQKDDTTTEIKQTEDAHDDKVNNASSTLPDSRQAIITEELPATSSSPKLIEVTSSRSKVRGRHRFSVIPENTTSKLKDRRKDKIVTDPSLVRSANPTLPRNNFKSTTPLTRVVKVKMRKEKLNAKYVFTCLDKALNRFYSDPRDCRLFHYCSPGYTSNQLVDMKFVCDLGTYYDDVKLICTKEKPIRCA